LASRLRTTPQLSRYGRCGPARADLPYFATDLGAPILSSAMVHKLRH